MGLLDDAGKPVALDTQLEYCIDDFVEGREAYWKSRPDGHDWVGGLDGEAERIAKVLLSDTDQLPVTVGGRPESETFKAEREGFFKNIAELMQLARDKLGVKHVPPFWEDFIESLAKENRPPDGSMLLAPVWERLCISLAKDLVGNKLVRGANRMLRLIELIREAEPEPVTLRYLNRVSRCYILGLDAECAILCRGVIDSALREALPEPECDLHLAQRIQAAAGKSKAQNGKDASSKSARKLAATRAKKPPLLDETGRKAAHRVNDVAKSGVHDDPDLAHGILSVMRDMLEVVGQVAPLKHASGTMSRGK